MNKIIPPLLATGLILLCACLSSVHPFYTDDDVVFDARLVGAWGTEDKDSREEWRFSGTDGKAYNLWISEREGKSGLFIAHLFKLGDHLFLDLTPRKVELAPGQADLVAFALIPGHLLLHVHQVEPTLKLAFSDFKWWEEFLKKNPRALAHVTTGDDGKFVTAETRDLQRFILAHLADGELFGKTEEAQEMKLHEVSAAKPPGAPPR